ncbi:MAG: radical SAM protein, partial [Treponema sp.]|nr:radical SAM protein [Treponema sp.]
QECKNRGIPTVVWICPILPYINDTIENLQTLLTYCKETNVKGIINFGMGLTLREGNREYFYAQLDKHFPGLKETYIKTYGNSYEIPSKNSLHLFKLFYDFCRQNKIMSNPDQIFAYMNTFEEKNPIVQLELF